MREKMFAAEKINTGRQPELDVAKAVQVFLLAYIHVIIACTPEEKLGSGLPFVFDSVIGGALSAPMFMFAMGACLHYTRHNSWKDFIRRGIGLCITNYVLNVFRYLIPYLIGYGITGDYEYYLEQLPYLVFGNDVLMLAGLFLIVLGLLKRFRCSDWWLVAFIAVGYIGAQLVRGMDFGHPVLNVVLGYFVGTEDAAGLVCSEFPLFHWMLFPVAGYLFGKCLLHVKNKGLFYSSLFGCIGIPFLLLTGYQIWKGIGIYGEGQMCFYHMTFLDALLACGLNVGVLSFCYPLARGIPAGLLRIVQLVSHNVNRIFCIHWVIVVVITDLILPIGFGRTEYPMGVLLAISTAISVVSILLAHGYSRIREKTGG